MEEGAGYDFLYRCRVCRDWDDCNEATLLCPRCALAGEYAELVVAGRRAKRFFLDMMHSGFHVCPYPYGVKCTTRIYRTGASWGSGPFVSIRHVTEYEWELSLYTFGTKGSELVFGKNSEVWK